MNPYYHNMPWWGSENISGYGDSTGPFDERSQSVNYGQLGEGVTAGVTAGQAFGVQNNEFGISGGNVLGGAASGAAQGIATGNPLAAGVGAVVGGVTSYLKQDAALKKNIENVNTSFNTVNDMYGRPQYNSGEYAQGITDLANMNKGIAGVGRNPIGVSRLKQLGNKRNALYTNLIKGQQSYNTAESNYRDRNLQMRDYLERINRNYTY